MTFFLISSSFISSSIIIQLDACSSLCICIHILLITLLLHLWSNTSTSLLLICPPQSFWRSYVARSRFMSLKKAAIATQCAWRGRVARKELRKLKMVRSSVVNGLTIFYFISYWRASAVFILFQCLCIRDVWWIWIVKKGVHIIMLSIDNWVYMHMKMRLCLHGPNSIYRPTPYGVMVSKSLWSLWANSSAIAPNGHKSSHYTSGTLEPGSTMGTELLRKLIIV